MEASSILLSSANITVHARREEIHRCRHTDDALKKELHEIAAQVKDEQEFTSFLCHCSEQLGKGVPVQAIWTDYPASDFRK